MRLPSIEQTRTDTTVRHMSRPKAPMHIFRQVIVVDCSLGTVAFMLFFKKATLQLDVYALKK
jgi:hypothetical protein